MENHNIIDEHLIHDPSQGLGKLQSIIRTSGVLAIIGGVLTMLGIFQEIFSVGKRLFYIYSSSFDEYMIQQLFNILTTSIAVIIELILLVLLFKFGFVAVNAGKKKLGQLQWNGLFKGLKNIMYASLGLSLVSVLSYIFNIFFNLIF